MSLYHLVRSVLILFIIEQKRNNDVRNLSLYLYVSLIGGEFNDINRSMLFSLSY